jgi:hypothetical protein
MTADTNQKKDTAMSEFLRKYLPVRIQKLDKNDAAARMTEPNKGRWFRLYCTQHAEAWTIQLAGPLGIGMHGMKDGKDFVIAGLSLTRAELEGLRAAIDAQLEDAQVVEDAQQAGGR